MVKVAAGWLIEQAGWKGKWLGNVRMHKKQALVLTTNGQASYQEVVDLKDKIITNIKERFGVTLEPEPQVDRKSTRLNSSHVRISYAVFCLKKKKRKDSGVRVTTMRARTDGNKT